MEADWAQVRQALRAVALNGIEAAPAGGWVRLGWQREAGGGLAFVVEDNGPGIPSAFHDGLFDPFFCGRPAGRGQGLGLSIAWRLAAQNGGSVRFDPRPGGPTRFVMTLPRAADALISERKSA